MSKMPTITKMLLLCYRQKAVLSAAISYPYHKHPTDVIIVS